MERLFVAAVAVVLDYIVDDIIGSIVLFAAPDLNDEPPVGLIAANCIVPPRFGSLSRCYWPLLLAPPLLAAKLSKRQKRQRRK